MMKDEDIQKRVEQGLTSSNDRDEKAYQTVFGALQMRPDFELPVYFADRLIEKITKQNESKSSGPCLWLVIGIFSLTVVLIIAVAMSFKVFRPDVGFLKYLFEYRGLVLTAIVLIGVFNWLDKKMMRQMAAY